MYRAITKYNYTILPSSSLYTLLVADSGGVLGSGHPPFVPRCRFVNIGPKAGPSHLRGDITVAGRGFLEGADA